MIVTGSDNFRTLAKMSPQTYKSNTCSLAILALFCSLSIRLNNMLGMRTEVGLCVYQPLTFIYTHVNIWKEHHHSYSVSDIQVHH